MTSRIFILIADGVWAMPSAPAGRQSPSQSSLSRPYRATIGIADMAFLVGAACLLGFALAVQL